MLDIDKILFIKSDNVYVEIFTDDHKYIQRKFLGQIVDELPEKFVRVHRSYLVNREHITGRERNFLKINDHKIPVSRKFKLEELI